MKLKISVIISVILSGCGVFNPQLAQFQDDQLYEIDVKNSIDCSIVDAVHEANFQAETIEELRGRKAELFEDWGLEYQYTLKTVESTNANPTIDVLSPATPINMLMPGDTVFSLNTGLNLSAKATKTVTNSDFDPMDVWLSKGKCDPQEPRNKISIAGDDLGIKGWLTSRLALLDSGSITAETAKSAFTYRLDFEIGRRANVDPKWSFVRRKFNKASGLFNTERTNTNTILVTFGPVEDKARLELARKAADQHLARQIAVAIGEN